MAPVLESDSEDELPMKKKNDVADDDDDSEEEEEDEEEDSEEEEEPKKKKQKKEKKTKKKKKDDDDSDSANSDVVDDLSGDEVDTSNIIAGGRASRSTRPVFTKQMYQAANLDDESEDEE